MSTRERIGADLQGGTEEARRQAASMMGSARTEKKTASSRENAAKAAEARRGSKWTEEQRAKLREAQSARREREKQERMERGEVVNTAGEKRKPGRPKKEETGTAIDALKRPVGRPKKQAPTITEETPE